MTLYSFSAGKRAVGSHKLKDSERVVSWNFSDATDAGYIWFDWVLGELRYTTGTMLSAGFVWQASPYNMVVTKTSSTGCGTQTAALSIAGWDGFTSNPSTQEYDGTSWALSSDVSVARYWNSSAGIQTAAWTAGGWAGSYTVVTEEYDGTSWSSGGNLNTAREYLAGCGTQSAGLSFGGNNGSVSAVTEEYDGTSWSIESNLNTARDRLAGCGVHSAALSFGGNGPSAVTEEYNKSTIINTLATV